MDFEQYARLHHEDPKIAICETASIAVFVLNSSFTTKDNYFRVVMGEACEALKKVLLECGYPRKIEVYDPKSICSTTASSILTLKSKLLH